MLNVVEEIPVDVTPDTSLFPKSGQTGYSLTQAIAELVDNSLDARIPGKDLIVNVFLGEKSVTVEDNAKGMKADEAKKMLVLGYSIKKNLLGEFGIGMKAACTSLGRRFSVLTYPDNSNYGYLCEFNEEEWTKKRGDDWIIQLKVIEKSQSQSEIHGTTIKIENLKRRINKARKKDLLRDFGNRFAPFIRSQNVRIFVNQEECRPEQVDLIEGTRKEFLLTTEKGEEIWGWYGLMKKGSDKGLYGFNTFRRGRMITVYDKVGILIHPTVSRIIGEIHLDHVPVTHNKKEFEKESDEYKEAERLLAKEFKYLVNRARETTLTAKITEDVRARVENYKEAIVRAFHELKDSFDIEEPLERKRSLNPDDPLESIIIESRTPPVHRVMNRIIAKDERLRNPREHRQIVVSHTITVAGKRYEIRHDFAALGKEAGWKAYDYSPDKGTILVLTNTDFPAFAITNDTPFYAAIHISESIAEIVSKYEENLTQVRVQEIKEKILRRAFEITEDFQPSDTKSFTN